MIIDTRTYLFAFVAGLLGACSGGAGADDPSSSEPAKQTLVLSGDCTFAECGSPPSSLESVTKVSCSRGSEACGWSNAAGDGSVSYRECNASECPEKPSIQCPAGTNQASQTCGSENDGACAWTTTCIPARNTTPCADSHGCDGQPLLTIGVICSDGSTGGFNCVTDGHSCHWERDCD